MSVDIMENDHDGDHQGLRLKGHESNKHSYFLRAKTTTRFLWFHEDGDEFKKASSSVSRVGTVDGSRTGRYGDGTSLSEEEDLANCLVMLSSNKSHKEEESNNNNNNNNKVVKEVVEKMGCFQCKACKKVFTSHQALGGHRASHKKVKGCFASKVIEDIEDDVENVVFDDRESSAGEEQEAALILPPPDPQPARKRAKMHECSVCRRVFSSGQALGGHKRCHWLTTSADNAFIPNFHDFHYDHHTQQLCKKPIFAKTKNEEHELDLNLNLPPASHHDQSKNLDDDGGGEKSTSGGKYEASTRLCLQQWTHAKAGNDVVIERESEEGCGMMKLRKLSDLRDVNLDGGWLQMGIPSTTSQIMR